MRPPSLAGADWLVASRTQAVLAVLDGGADATRIVGGAVRNALLGQEVTDIDMATVLEPAEVMERAEAAGLKVVPTGIEHGTVTIVAGGTPVEVTTLRADIRTDGRRAVVRFTDDWGADAGRRDFTINALYCDAAGRVHDPVGGYDDLRAGRVRFIGDADMRIKEDYLRILRFFRFFAWYGSGRPDAEGLKACARLKGGLATLSAERLWSELKRLLAAPDPGRALLWMRTTEVLQKALPESWGIDAVHRLVAAERAEGWAPDPMLRLIAILPPHRARVEGVARRLKLSNAERDRLLRWLDVPEADPDMDRTRLGAMLYRHGPGPAADRLCLALAREADAGNAPAADRLRTQLEEARAWVRPDFPVRGQDLVTKGVPPGPAVGTNLKQLEERWIESGFALDREALLALAEVPGAD